MKLICALLAAAVIISFAVLASAYRNTSPPQVQPTAEELITEAAERLAAGDLYEAKWALQDALKLNPNSPTANKLMGDVCWADQSDFDTQMESLEYYRTAMDINPGYIAAFSAFQTVICTVNSCSGGYFLGEEEINELRQRSERLRQAKGYVPGELEMLPVFADSYGHLCQYEEALACAQEAAALLENAEELDEQLAHMDSLIETYQWLVANHLVKEGKVALFPRPGPPNTSGASIAAELDDGRYLWRSYFKGAVVCYDRKSDEHFVAYVHETQYDWATALATDKDNLWMGLHSGGGLVCFNKRSHTISQIDVPEGLEIEKINPSRHQIVLNEEISIDLPG